MICLDFRRLLSHLSLIPDCNPPNAEKRQKETSRQVPGVTSHSSGSESEQLVLSDCPPLCIHVPWRPRV